jgi:hypothetical protein
LIAAVDVMMPAEVAVVLRLKPSSARHVSNRPSLWALDAFDLCHAGG